MGWAKKMNRNRSNFDETNCYSSSYIVHEESWADILLGPEQRSGQLDSFDTKISPCPQTRLNFLPPT